MFCGVNECVNGLLPPVRWGNRLGKFVSFNPDCRGFTMDASQALRCVPEANVLVVLGLISSTREQGEGLRNDSGIYNQHFQILLKYQRKCLKMLNLVCEAVQCWSERDIDVFACMTRYGMMNWRSQQLIGRNSANGNMGPKIFLCPLGRIWQYTGAGTLWVHTHIFHTKTEVSQSHWYLWKTKNVNTFTVLKHNKKCYISFVCK